MVLLLVLCFSGLAFRLVDVQVFRHAQLQDLARNNTHRTFVKESRRGDIRDARGNLLATSKVVETVCADPSLIGPYWGLLANRLGPLLGMETGALAQKLKPTLLPGRTNVDKYVVLKRKVDEEVWLGVKKSLEDLKFAADEKKLPQKDQTFYNRLRQGALFAEADLVRVYPNGALAAHVLGYVGMEEVPTRNGKELQTLGKDGLEFSLNGPLTGIRGWRQTETDSHRRELVAFRDQEVAARAGLNAILTIDAGVQHIVETELAEAMQKHTPISASCVVLRPKTGEILALANFPTFNPNDPSAPPENHRNRVISSLSEPGSTFKIVVVSGALEERLISLGDNIDCEMGHFVYAGKVLHDHVSYGVLSVEKIITKSSNIGAAKIGIKLHEDRLYDYIRKFGFGQKTMIPLPGEESGITHAVENWTKLSITRIPMGHEVAVTPIQMVMAMAAIANKGVLMRPMLVSQLMDDKGQEVVRYKPQVVRRTVGERAAGLMVNALKTVVSTNGTGEKARLSYYNVAGKTGTAQKVVNKQYARGKYFSSFIGFFPADDPELCISVVFDEPHNGHYGGETAAPVFKRIAEASAKYLAIPPEIIPTENPDAAASGPARSVAD